MKPADLAPLLPLAALTSQPAWAHPGDHTPFLSRLAEHLLSEPDHLALIALSLALAAGLVWLRRQRASQRRDKRDPSDHDD